MTAPKPQQPTTDPAPSQPTAPATITLSTEQQKEKAGKLFSTLKTQAARPGAWQPYKKG